MKGLAKAPPLLVVATVYNRLKKANEKISVQHCHVCGPDGTVTQDIYPCQLMGCFVGKQ